MEDFVNEYRTDLLRLYTINFLSDLEYMETFGENDLKYSLEMTNQYFQKNKNFIDRQISELKKNSINSNIDEIDPTNAMTELENNPDNIKNFGNGYIILFNDILEDDIISEEFLQNGIATFGEFNSFIKYNIPLELQDYDRYHEIFEQVVDILKQKYLVDEDLLDKSFDFLQFYCHILSNYFEEKYKNLLE